MLAPGLSVTIVDGATSRVVTKYCTNLRYTKVAPGGHQQLQVQMSLSHGMFPHLGPNDRIVVTDQRTAVIVFDGYLKNPTPVDGPFGQYFDITALGGMWRATDESRPLVYITGDLAEFASTTTANVATSVDTDAGDGLDRNGAPAPFPGFPRVRTQFNSGQAIATGDVAQAYDNVFSQTGMDIAAISVTVQSGRSDADYRTSVFHDGPPSGGRVDIGNGAGGIITGPITSTLWMTADFPFGTRRFSFALLRTGAPTNVASEDVWAAFIDPRALGRRVSRYGTPLTTAADHGNAPRYVLAKWVVEDLVGRLLTMCDSDTAVIEDTTFQIDQLAYVDGARAVDVLTHLLVWESEFLWEILERLPNGRHRFGFRAWPTTPRYVVSVKDGWVERGSDANVCNRILITWTDAAGAKQSLSVTAADLLTDGLVTLADLDGVGDGLTAGQIRDAEQFNLGDGKGSAANAARIGRMLLLESIKPPRAGTVTIRRKVLDLLTGCEVMPWELEPGYVCRVREKGYDLRITEASYDHGDQSMALTLGTPVLTSDQRLVRLAAA